jgi:hypothetical protein
MSTNGVAVNEETEDACAEEVGVQVSWIDGCKYDKMVELVIPATAEAYVPRTPTSWWNYWRLTLV